MSILINNDDSQLIKVLVKLVVKFFLNFFTRLTEAIMKLQKLSIVALAVIGSFSATASAEVKESESNKDLKASTSEGEGFDFCKSFPWACMGTDSNGGGKEPGKKVNESLRNS